MDKTPRAENELLNAEEVAGLMGVSEETVWRWCRDGTLPCLKVGRWWRVRREALDDFLRKSERSTTLVGKLGAFLQAPDNVLIVAQNRDLMHRLDAAFFRVGEARGGMLVKFYGGEEEGADELRAQLERDGLGVGRLEGEGRFLMRPERDPFGDREDELEGLLDEHRDGRVVWASFDWAKHVDLDTAMEQQERLGELVGAGHLVVKTAVLEETVDDWPAKALRRAQTSHSGTVWAAENGLSLSRKTPMPPS